MELHLSLILTKDGGRTRKYNLVNLITDDEARITRITKEVLHTKLDKMIDEINELEDKSEQRASERIGEALSGRVEKIRQYLKAGIRT